jgi:hypothetical protein
MDIMPKTVKASTSKPVLGDHNIFQQGARDMPRR